MVEIARVWGRPMLQVELCTGCGLCTEACPCGAARLDGDRPIFACERCCTGQANCAACRGGFYPCQLVCESDAIQISFAIQHGSDKE